jgi:CRP/FNR family cyclic AMP-dependent transcriptional regulator
MQSVGDLLLQQPFFADLDRPTVLMLEGCAHNVHMQAGGYLFREGEPANTFYLVRRGRVALEVHAPGSGDHVLDTVEEGQVLGWSWLVPPYRWFFDARAAADVSAVAVDATCLRAKCTEDPALGYALMLRVAHVMYQRLQSSRMRLLDLYGGRDAG